MKNETGCTHGEEAWYCDACAFAREKAGAAAQSEVAALRARVERMIGMVQRYQPGGSPPPGDETTLVPWIMNSLRERAEAAEESMTATQEQLRAVMLERNARVDALTARAEAAERERDALADGCRQSGWVPHVRFDALATRLSEAEEALAMRQRFESELLLRPGDAERIAAHLDVVARLAAAEALLRRWRRVVEPPAELGEGL